MARASRRAINTREFATVLFILRPNFWRYVAIWLAVCSVIILTHDMTYFYSIVYCVDCRF